jgi:APA family basic amino acid/polyamine antiporter
LTAKAIAQEGSARPLSLLDCIGLGINGVVGSGIYLLVGPMAKLAGPASIAGTVLCGLLCTLVALCFAELGGMFDSNGGAYLYARSAFGTVPGFFVGWMSLSTGVLAFAAVAQGFGEAMAGFLPWLSGTSWAIALILGLSAVNFLNVKAGARASDLLSLGKLIPLLILAVFGLWVVRGELLTAALPPLQLGDDRWRAIASASLLAVFMLSGFEYTAVPAGEAAHARRNIPIAIVSSLVGATVLYAVLQWVALSTVPNVAQSGQPLVEAGVRLFGPWAEVAFRVAALLSMAGFCAGSALVGPRYFTALADGGYLPPQLLRVTRFNTPGSAIVLSAALTCGLVLSSGYGALVDVSNVALFAQYIPTSVAVIVLRIKMPEAPRRFRLPGGPTIPLLATFASVTLLWAARPRMEEWLFAGRILAAGLVTWLASALWGDRRGRDRV